MTTRKHRLANGRLRPAARRYFQKRRRARRESWLANFEPGERDRFFFHIQLEQAVFLSAFMRETGLPRDEAAAAMARIAGEWRWRKLRTKDGIVVGIAPPKPEKEE